ncbi:MAG: CPBP family intramembrane metalloprotease [Candidatus Rokubacteria bacterium]|nr:CPBP family intramembrane metalloprotease [Candidatus Rokubacteria bacterium]
MWALAARREPRVALLDGTPWALLGVLAAAVALVATLAVTGWLPRRALGPAAIAGAHGALLGAALAWAGERGATAWVPALLLALAAAAAAVDHAGALAYLVVPLWLGALARDGRLAALGLGPRPPRRGVVAGIVVGAGLGAHLLVTASLTLGYHIAPGMGSLSTLAYDAGANVISGELFFRGALFNRLQRRWSFAAAAAVATAASLARYLVDPLLPKLAEATLGGLFYLTLLGVANCWLFWWSGSLVPGLLAALGFFAAYRQLVLP